MSTTNTDSKENEQQLPVLVETEIEDYQGIEVFKQKNGSTKIMILNESDYDNNTTTTTTGTSANWLMGNSLPAFLLSSFLWFVCCRAPVIQLMTVFMDRLIQVMDLIPFMILAAPYLLEPRRSLWEPWDYEKILILQKVVVIFVVTTFSVLLSHFVITYYYVHVGEMDKKASLWRRREPKKISDREFFLMMVFIITTPFMIVGFPYLWERDYKGIMIRLKTGLEYVVYTTLDYLWERDYKGMVFRLMTGLKYVFNTTANYLWELDYKGMVFRMKIRLKYHFKYRLEHAIYTTADGKQVVDITAVAFFMLLSFIKAALEKDFLVKNAQRQDPSNGFVLPYTYYSTS